MRSLLFFVFVSSSFYCLAQVGGNHVYPFLNMSSSARTSALGGSLITSTDGDVSLAYENPALSREALDNQIGFQHQFIFAGIQTGQVSFAKWLTSKNLMLHGGVKYMLYGEFDQTDIFGNQTGTFKGNDVSLYAGASYQVYDNLRIGANLKFISSSLEVYRSSGFAFDFGALYVDTSGLFSAGLTIRNAGTQISTYDQVRETLPLIITIGLSRRLKHLPFRFFLTYNNLQNWNLLYDDPNTEEGGFFGGFQTIDQEPTQLDNFFRHILFGGELMLGKNEVFKIRLGYNHQRKQELSVTNFKTLTGFSLGFGVKFKKLNFDYAVSKVHFGGSTHHLGITTNLKKFTTSPILN